MSSNQSTLFLPMGDWPNQVFPKGMACYGYCFVASWKGVPIKCVGYHVATPPPKKKTIDDRGCTVPLWTDLWLWLMGGVSMLQVFIVTNFLMVCPPKDTHTCGVLSLMVPKKQCSATCNVDWCMFVYLVWWPRDVMMGCTHKRKLVLDKQYLSI